MLKIIVHKYRQATRHTKILQPGSDVTNNIHLGKNKKHMFYHDRRSVYVCVGKKGRRVSYE